MSIRQLVVGALSLCIGLPAFAACTAFVAVVLFLNHTNGSVVAAGRQRDYLLYVPPSYNRARPAPLVISLHGALRWPAAHMEVTQWNRLADEHGFIVVYPAGRGVGPRAWFMDGADAPSAMPDVTFIATLIDELKAVYNIDPARVYADGTSNGGGMTFVLSCTLADSIAAVATVSGAPSLPWSWCRDRRPMPMMAIHGTKDTVVPYDGGTSWMSRASFPAVRTWTANCARRNGCDPDPVDVAESAVVTRTEYRNCGGGPVLLYTVRGGVHPWPWARATSVIWSFFREQRLKS